MVWKLAEARNRFGELVDRALTEGPQHVRRRDDVVVVLSAAEYERLAGHRKRTSLTDLILDGPSFEGVDLERPAATGALILDPWDAGGP